MPYTPENVDELAKLCRWNTSYSIERLNGGNRMKVDSLKDFREGVAEELLVLNHVANSQERQYLADMKAGKLQAQPKVYLWEYGSTPWSDGNQISRPAIKRV
jgi:hypothetical protein